LVEATRFFRSFQRRLYFLSRLSAANCAVLLEPVTSQATFAVVTDLVSAASDPSPEGDRYGHRLAGGVQRLHRRR
jgi:hypothetical protein